MELDEEKKRSKGKEGKKRRQRRGYVVVFILWSILKQPANHFDFLIIQKFSKNKTAAVQSQLKSQ